MVTGRLAVIGSMIRKSVGISVVFAVLAAIAAGFIASPACSSCGAMELMNVAGTIIKSALIVYMACLSFAALYGSLSRMPEQS
ncbi:hypothetical protein L3Q72_01805 [Vibrio sp. JC009]|uniref:hypothetical protein n=1 Tax=Vibrio sp. JC009 TaxID=2912314 RepID=UPI0023B04D3F|nr:hypothetical protein [Vibrio sp. JC009]WED22180.1 hypothetical protein L3Q72_01805 [Vibrio sp. JC009]